MRTTPTPLTDAQLDAAGLNGLEVLSYRDGMLDLRVDEQYAGEDLAVFVHSTPIFLGWHVPDAAGEFAVQLPGALTSGEHRVAVLEADGSLVGVATITVERGADGTIDVLSVTGAGAVAPWLVAGALLLVLGAALIVVRRRTREGVTTV